MLRFECLLEVDERLIGRGGEEPVDTILAALLPVRNDVIFEYVTEVFRIDFIGQLVVRELFAFSDTHCLHVAVGIPLGESEGAREEVEQDAADFLAFVEAYGFEDEGRGGHATGLDYLINFPELYRGSVARMLVHDYSSLYVQNLDHPTIQFRACQTKNEACYTI